MTLYEELTAEDDVMRDLHERKARLMEQYGGWEGYLKHLDEERPRLEAEGWRFVGPEDVIPSGN